MGKWLGNPLKWLASLGTGAVSSLIFWLLSLVHIEQAHTSALLFGFVVAAVAKFVGWLVATYYPPPKTVARTRRPRKASGARPFQSEPGQPAESTYPPKEPPQTELRRGHIPE